MGSNNSIKIGLRHVPNAKGQLYVEPYDIESGRTIETIDLGVHFSMDDATTAELLVYIHRTDGTIDVAKHPEHSGYVQWLNPGEDFRVTTRSPNSTSDPERGTGRTTRMLMDAIRWAAIGKSVIVVGRNAYHATILRDATKLMVAKLGLPVEHRGGNLIRVGDKSARVGTVSFGSGSTQFMRADITLKDHSVDEA